MRLAFGGKACSGKTTAANFMAEKYGFKVIKFAQPIYDILKVLEIPKSRRIMQSIGKVLREWDPNIFIHLMDRYLYMKEQYPKLIVDDVRMDNEVLFLKDKGFRLILIISDDEIRKQRAHDLGLEWNDDDETEREFKFIDKFHYIITNDSSLDVLYEKLETIYRKEKERMENEVYDY